MADEVKKSVQSGEKGKKEKKTKKSWFKGLKAEFKKIIWSSRQSLIRQTVAVVVSTVVLGALIVLIDNLVRLGLGLLIK